MTLNSRYALYGIIYIFIHQKMVAAIKAHAQTHICFYGVHLTNMNEDLTHAISSRNVTQRLRFVWLFKVCVVIRGGSLDRTHQRTVEVEMLKMSTLSTFGHCVFGTFRDKTNKLL